ncbi:melanoma-associated antigen 10-like [Rousettus aegyptiacus]|uniref:melanoma-associated antigen 10-like n=1 Tax=Rousettus aegyptiacus TaxID=9407 RepID=UPI00168CB9A3|nr:melanoma-associated antigen 10-like [Rousettus aegyptiacus]
MGSSPCCQHWKTLAGVARRGASSVLSAGSQGADGLILGRCQSEGEPQTLPESQIGTLRTYPCQNRRDPTALDPTCSLSDPDALGCASRLHPEELSHILMQVPRRENDLREDRSPTLKRRRKSTRRKRRSPQSSGSSSPSSSTSWSTSDGDSSSQDEDTSSLQISVDTESPERDLLDEKVTDLVRFMILKYRLRKQIAEAEMLKLVIKECKSEYPVIFKRACRCLEVISGIDVKEVDPTTHSYVLINSLDLTYDDMLGDDQSMPKNGLLMIILGVIFMVGNCAPEKDMWDFLNTMGIYAGREHFIYGEPRKLLTRDWVRENYLEYRQVPGSDPPCYQFLWGPRAHAETSKLKVLDFLAKIKGTDPISLSCWYVEALRDERERAQGRVCPTDRAAPMFVVQRRSAASPFPN